MPETRIMFNALLAIGTGSSSADRDVSNRMKTVKWTEEFEEHDVTVMGSVTRARAIGLGEASVEAEVLQSYTTTDGGENIDNLVDTLRDVSATGKRFLVRWRRENAGKSSTNPEYSMLCVLSQRTIVDGEVGMPMMNTLTFLSADSLSRSAASS